MRFLFVLALLASAAAPAAQKHDDVLPMPPALSAPTLDADLLRDTSLCVFPFVKETTGGASDTKYLESIQKAFFDVAKDSPLLKDVVLLGENTSRCDPHDAACFSAVGKMAGCENVLVGSSAAKGNGFVLSVRIFEVGKGRVLPGSEVEQVLETDRQADVQAWAEGQACRGLSVSCEGTLRVDADRKDMSVYVDNRLTRRSFKAPESIAVEPGVHGVRVAVGQRTSLEKKVAVRRGGVSELIYARQTEKGGLPLWLASDLHGTRPDPSVEVQEGGWKKPVGYSMAAAGLLAAGIGAYEGLHGRSLMNGANDRFRAQSGYFQSDLATIDSARSAASTANILFAVGGVLMAAGLTTVFVF
jgi:TolB-like protein